MHNFLGTPPDPVKVVKKIYETDIENYLRKQVIKIGGKSWKWKSQNLKGAFDQICFLPWDVIWIVECKRNEKLKLSRNQQKRSDELDEIGCTTKTKVGSKRQVDELIKYWIKRYA